MLCYGCLNGRIEKWRCKANFRKSHGHALNLACSDAGKSSTVLRYALVLYPWNNKIDHGSPRKVAIFRNLSWSHILTIQISMEKIESSISNTEMQFPQRRYSFHSDNNWFHHNRRHTAVQRNLSFDWTSSCSASNKCYQRKNVQHTAPY